MTEASEKHCPVSHDDDPALRCGAGPAARWRFLWRELRGWLRQRKS